MRSTAHWTPRYIRDRLALWGWERAHPDDPWLTATSIEFLGQWLGRNDRGLECGSGRSTSWFARRIEALTSLEHDRAWFDRVQASLARQGLAGRVDYHLYPDGESERDDSEYVRHISNLEDASLDFALIDGVARDHCANACISKLKRGGLLIVDNINWYLPHKPPSPAPASRQQHDGPLTEGWARFLAATSSWRCFWTTNGVSDTAMWFRSA
jgi:hypothetical protein